MPYRAEIACQARVNGAIRTFMAGDVVDSIDEENHPYMTRFGVDEDLDVPGMDVLEVGKTRRSRKRLKGDDIEF